MSLKPLWHLHPHVRSGTELLYRERAADWLKARFGSWSFLITLNTVIVAWMVLEWLHVLTFDPYPFIALNLFLSWLAAQQGGALQIASNRGDRISSELAQHTYENAQEILKLNQAQMAILEELRTLNARLDADE